MDFNQFIHPEMPESHNPNLQAGKVIGWVRGTIIDTKDPEGLGRVKVMIGEIDRTSATPNSNEGFCTVGERYTVNERLGGTHRLLEVGTTIAMIPMLGDMKELLLLDCLPNRYDKPDPDLDRSKGRHGETTPGGVRRANDDKKMIQIESHPKGVIKSISSDGDVQTQTAGGARQQLSHTGDARVESPRGFLQTTADGQVTLANSSGSSAFFQPTGEVAVSSAFGSGMGLTQNKCEYKGPLSEPSAILQRCKRNITGNLSEAITALVKMKGALNALDLEQEEAAPLLAIFSELLRRLEERLVTNFSTGIKDLETIEKFTEDQIGRSIAGQVGEAYDLNLKEMKKKVEQLFEEAPQSSKALDDIRGTVGQILTAKIEHLFRFFPSKLRQAGSNVYSSVDLTELQVKDIAQKALSGNLTLDVKSFIQQITNGDRQQDFVMEGLQRIAEGDPQHDGYINRLGSCVAPAFKAAFGLELPPLSSEGLQLSAVMKALTPVAEQISASIGVPVKEINAQIKKGVPSGDFREKLKEVLPPDLLEHGIFPSPKLTKILNDSLQRLKFAGDRRQEALLSVLLPQGYKSIQNILAMDVLDLIPDIKSPWVIVRPGEVDSDKDKKKAVDAISKKQVKIIDAAYKEVSNCQELIELIPVVHSMLSATIRQDVENFDWSLEQVKSRLPVKEISINDVKTTLRKTCSPLLNYLPQLQKALRSTQALLNCLPDAMPSAQLSISESAGVLESGSRHNGGRLQLSHAQTGMYGPNGRSAIFTESENAGMRVGKQNAMSIHAGDGAKNSWSTIFNAGSIAMRNTDPENKSSGLSMGRDGKLSMSSFPAIAEKAEALFDLYGDGTDWLGATAEVAVAASSMIAKTSSLEGAAQTVLELSGAADSPVGKVVMGALKDGSMESLLELAGDAAGGAGSAVLKILKDGKPESALELLNSPQGAGILQKIFSGGVLQSLSGNIGGMQLAMSFIKDPKSMFSLDGIMQIAELAAGASPTAMMAMQGGKMLMKGLGGGFEIGDTLKILGAAGGALEVGEVVKLAGMDVVQVIGDVMSRLDALESAFGG